MSQTVQKEFSFLGVSLTTPVPADAASWDEIAGQGDCVLTAIEQHGYRGYASPARSAMLKALKDSKSLEPAEGEGADKFIKRVTGEGKLSAAEWQEIGSNAVVAAGITFVSTLAASGTSRAKVGKEYVEQANYLIAKWAAGEGSPAGTLAKIQKYVPGAVMPADTTDPVAWGALIRAKVTAQKEQDLL